MADARTDQILGKLQEDGGRVTRTRRMVLDVLLNSDDHHLTAADIVEGVRHVDPSFPESTVYRTLTRLEELGVVAPLSPLTPGRAVTYHLSADPHVHAVCDRCDAVFEHDPEVLASLREALRDEHGFTLDVQRTAIHGICRACRDASRLQ